MSIDDIIFEPIIPPVIKPVDIKVVAVTGQAMPFKWILVSQKAKDWGKKHFNCNDYLLAKHRMSEYFRNGEKKFVGVKWFEELKTFNYEDE
jgi:hypothetical protein